MLSPNDLMTCSLKAEELASELKQNIVDDIVQKILIRKKENLGYLLTQSDIYQLEILTDSGEVLSDLQKLIAKKSGTILKEIKQAIKNGAYKSAKYDDALYKAVGLKPPDFFESPGMMRLIERNFTITQGSFWNYCQTTANSGQKVFINTLDKAYNEIMMGSNTVDGAFLKAIKSVIDGTGDAFIGYPTKTKSGKERRISLEAATLMCLRTGVSQCAAQVTEFRMNEMGVDLVITTSHFDARPEHQEWQGKVFSRWEGDPKYPYLYDSQEDGGTGYGTVTGLCGANCRHSFMPYFEGQKITYPRYNEEENREAYELTQKQRAIERKVRGYKQKANSYLKLANGADDSDPLKQEWYNEYKKNKTKADNWAKEYRQFCKDHELRPLSVRLAVAEKVEDHSKPLKSKKAKGDVFDRTSYFYLDSVYGQEFKQWHSEYLKANSHIKFSRQANPGLYKYTSNYYTEMNECLWKGYYHGIQDGTYTKSQVPRMYSQAISWIDKCHDEIQKFRLEKSIHVRRMDGSISHIVGDNTEEAIKQNIGKEWVCKNFLSTRVSLEDSGFGHIAYEIYIPAGHPVAYVDDFSCFSGEYELLIDRGTKFKVRGGGVRQVQSRWGGTHDEMYIELEVIGQEL